MGAICEISTNFETVFAAAQECFSQIADPGLPADIRMRFWVDDAAQASAPWPKPYFRGLDHLVFAAFDCDNALLVDLRNRRVIGRFSPAMAADLPYWKNVIFPSLLGIVGPSVGIAALHCACVVRNDSGLLLAGPSGSGKSTLSLALAMNGFDLLSDDWTYFSTGCGRLVAWGLPTALKLLPDAVGHFPALCSLELEISLNGERAFQVEPNSQLGVRRSVSCVPRWLIFLEQEAKPAFQLVEITRAEAAARLEENLRPNWPEAIEPRREAIQRLAQCRCCLLKYGGIPQVVAQALYGFCGDTLEEVSPAASESEARHAS